MSEDVKDFLEELKEYSDGGISGLYPPEETVKEFVDYIEQLQQKNEGLTKKLFSPDQVEETCPNCGKKFTINYSREVYDLKEENKKLKAELDLYRGVLSENHRIISFLNDYEEWLKKKKENKEMPHHTNSLLGQSNLDICPYLSNHNEYGECLDKFLSLKSVIFEELKKE